MSNEDPLSRKVSTLLAENKFDGAALRLGKSGTPVALGHILQAIDDTMMLRHAIFAVGESAVTLRISGKRLLKVVSVTEDLDAPAGLIDQQLSSDATEALKQLAELLERLVAQKGVLTLERQTADTTTTQAGSGVGVQGLSACFAAQNLTASENGMDTFVSTCVSEALAVIKIADDKMSIEAGEQPEVDNLKHLYGEFWASFEDNHSAIVSTSDRIFLRIVAVSSAEDQGLIVAKVKEKQYVALITLGKIPAVASAWADVADLA